MCEYQNFFKFLGWHCHLDVYFIQLSNGYLTAASTLVEFALQDRNVGSPAWYGRWFDRNRWSHGVDTWTKWEELGGRIMALDVGWIIFFKGLIAGLIQGNQWLISLKIKALYFWGGGVYFRGARLTRHNIWAQKPSERGVHSGRNLPKWLN